MSKQVSPSETERLKTLKKILRYIDTLLASIGSRIVAGYTDFEPSSRPAAEKQKLLIDCTYLYSTNINTGIQRVVRNIVRHMEPQASKAEIELIPVALVNGTCIALDIDKITAFKKRPFLYTIAIRITRKIHLYLSSFFRAEKIYQDDILLMLDSSWYLPVWPSLEYAKRRGAHILAVSYDLIPISHPEFCDDRLQEVFRQWYSKTANYVEGYLSISKSVMHALTAYLQKQGIDTTRYGFDHFTLGSNFREENIQSEHVREALKKVYADNNSVYLTVSTIEPRKNHRYIFDNFKKLWAQSLDISWIIVGKRGWKTERLIHEIEEHEMFGKKLFIFDDLNDDELIYCYHHSKALIFASIIEGYGLPIVESLASRLPVLASNTEVHREVGGEGVIYFDLDEKEALFVLLRDIESGEKRLIKANQQHIQLANWDESAKELLEKISAIIEEKGKERDGETQ